MCAFYFFWLSASHGLRLGMDGMLLALCDHGFERSGLCAVNNNNNNNTAKFVTLGKLTYLLLYGTYLPVVALACGVCISHYILHLFVTVEHK